MRFTGLNLARVACALQRAIDNCQHEIGSHPEPLNYPEEIEDLKVEIEEYKTLQLSAQRAIQREMIRNA